MLWTLLALHGVGVVASAVAGKRSMRAGLTVAAIPPLVTAIWALTAMVGDHSPAVSELTWVEDLALSIRFQSDNVALLMTLLVSGIGALVFVYAIGYFDHDAPGGGRFPATLLAFSTSMLGLVWADSIWTLFIFWEFTSVTSFLLVGHKSTYPDVLAAARRALMITGGGGLALLAGLILLANESGTTVLSDLTPVDGRTATLAAILILVGAATKSAQFPFHVWLPGAMQAPTPVSAYLHSATMVKAGVLLVAVVGSTFADVTIWKVLGMTLGLVSMVWGAIGALRHRDAKLILAWGTVSQLGLLITLLAIGSGKAVFAAVSIIFAHAIFKAALFLVVGEIDIRTGTRDIEELNGLARSMPITFAVAVAAGLSMAGAPPLLGFPAKEAAIEAVLGLSGFEKLVGLVGVAGGSVLTVAYTIRFLFTVFGPAGPGKTETVVKPRRMAMTIPAVVLGVSSVGGFVILGAVNNVVRPAAVELKSSASVYSLLRWPGITTGLMVSLAVLAAGIGMGLVLARRTPGEAPAPLGADSVDASLDGILIGAKRITARVQHGSLPVYLATMAFVASVAAMPFVTDLTLDHLVWADGPVQAVLAMAVVGSAAAGAFVDSRLGAALTLGAVGIAMSGLFLVHGAPDLALTQLLVETIVVVGFVIGLGHLGRRFPEVANTWRNVRLIIAVGGGLAVMAALAASSASPTGQAPIADLGVASVEEGGGNNIVNVILTDMRALDTLGEVVVLAVVAVGILALANTRTKDESTPDTQPTHEVAT